MGGEFLVVCRMCPKTAEILGAGQASCRELILNLWRSNELISTAGS